MYIAEPCACIFTAVHKLWYMSYIRYEYNYIQRITPCIHRTCVCACVLVHFSFSPEVIAQYGYSASGSQLCVGNADKQF